MFNKNDKITFTVIGFDEHNQQLPFCVKLPIDDTKIDELTVPSNVDYISLFQYCENPKSMSGETVFRVYTGTEFVGMDVFDLDDEREIGKFFGGFHVNCHDKRSVSDIEGTRFCCKVDPDTKVRKIRAILEEDDCVIPKGEIQSIIIEMSSVVAKFYESVAAMKTLGKGKQHLGYKEQISNKR
jgi:hypothetical protein